jgi:hypothetical protein
MDEFFRMDTMQLIYYVGLPYHSWQGRREILYPEVSIGHTVQHIPSGRRVTTRQQEALTMFGTLLSETSNI